MIGKLTGLMDSSSADWAVIDVAGVGYVVHCSGRALANLHGHALFNRAISPRAAKTAIR